MPKTYSPSSITLQSSAQQLLHLGRLPLTRVGPNIGPDSTILSSDWLHFTFFFFFGFLFYYSLCLYLTEKFQNRYSVKGLNLGPTNVFFVWLLLSKNLFKSVAKI